MDNFLNEDFCNSLLENFPTKEELDIHWDGLNEQKSEGTGFENWHPNFMKVKKMVMSPAFSKWIGDVTGIENSIVTDDKLGCGLHLGQDGSFLDMHVDFNMHHTENKFRRLNLLIYLNKDWKEEYGGLLEMWDKDMKNCIQKVSPDFNRAVIFETSSFSWHGYGKVSLPQDMRRRSFYSYFYTDDQGKQKSYRDTTFKTRPDEAVSKKVVTDLKENLKNGVKRTLKALGIKF
jgi:Rps23 Pro-64 3,4-dihydroxylase Tpa1-like proline 4-hydroxylase